MDYSYSWYIYNSFNKEFMKELMTERERLMLVQGLIDRLLYIEGAERDFFLDYLDALYTAFPVPKKIKYFNEAFNENENSTN